MFGERQQPNPSALISLLQFRLRAPTILHQEPVSWKTVFPWTGVRGWFGDDSSALHLLCTLFLLVLHQLHLTSWGVRSWRWGPLHSEVSQWVRTGSQCRDSVRAGNLQGRKPLPRSNGQIFLLQRQLRKRVHLQHQAGFSKDKNQSHGLPPLVVSPREKSLMDWATLP